ncbi:hypothetical protein ACFIOY_39980 [Bradyrhizobium sp. TZ2]
MATLKNCSFPFQAAPFFHSRPDDNYAVQVTSGHGGTPFWEECFPMLFVLDLGSDDRGEFRDLALRGQNPTFLLEGTGLFY